MVCDLSICCFVVTLLWRRSRLILDEIMIGGCAELVVVRFADGVAW